MSRTDVEDDDDGWFVTIGVPCCIGVGEGEEEWIGVAEVVAYSTTNAWELIGLATGPGLLKVEATLPPLPTTRALSLEERGGREEDDDDVEGFVGAPAGVVVSEVEGMDEDDDGGGDDPDPDAADECSLVI